LNAKRNHPVSPDVQHVTHTYKDPKIIPDPASIKGNVFLAWGNHNDLLVGCIFCLRGNGYWVPILHTVSVWAKIT